MVKNPRAFIERLQTFVKSKSPESYNFTALQNDVELLLMYSAINEKYAIDLKAILDDKLAK